MKNAIKSILSKFADTLSIFFNCHVLQHHDWTSKALQNIDPDPIDKGASTEEILDKFNDYSTMYCDRCGKISELSKNRKIA